MRYVILIIIAALLIVVAATRDEARDKCIQEKEQASLELSTIATHLEVTRDIEQTVALLRYQASVLLETH